MRPSFRLLLALVVSSSCSFPEYGGFAAGDGGAEKGDASSCGDLGCAQSTCQDHVKDGRESDVDCGGPWGPCAANQSCPSGSDCASGACVSSICTMPGDTACHADADCASRVCRAGQCQIAT